MKYTVTFRTASGRLAQTTAVTREGYSTIADIPKMIAIKHGESAVIIAIVQQGISKDEEMVIEDGIMTAE